MIVNTRLLSAWPNWIIVPAMVALWIVVGVLSAELLGAQSYRSQ